MLSQLFSIDWSAVNMTGVALAALGLVLGGILKGATGAGAPIIAVPVMAIWFGVPTAVAIFAVPNLLANVWQAWHFRAERLPPRFTWGFAGMGAAGTALGTYLLANLPAAALTLTVALAVFVYLFFRLSKPAWVLQYAIAEKLAPLIGGIGGTLYGASGLSAPVTLSFLNAMRLERPQFIAVATLFFTMMGVVQLPMLFSLGIMTPLRFVLGLGALGLITGAMPVGNWLAKRISRQTFDRLIMLLLFLIASRLVIGAIWH
ncbi:MAG: sulfite exporter TauE/SafE family protein [Nitratireductor sp.]|nr:sulfite exporter TauE/SafE family protein [Nitratireductor sp.]